MERSETGQTNELRRALRRIWTMWVLTVGFVAGIAFAFVAVWPPQQMAEAPSEWLPIQYIAVVLMALYAIACFRYFVLMPVRTLMRDLPDWQTRVKIVGGLCRRALPHGLAVGIPMAVSVAFDLPDPFNFLPLLAVVCVYVGVRQWRSGIVSAAIADLSALRSA